MDNRSLPAGHRARQLVPSLGARGAIAASTAGATADEARLFWMTLLGGFVFFGTFFS
jgi:hypothetical protein